jgi:hypothetical protein
MNDAQIQTLKHLLDCYVQLNELRVKYHEHAHFLHEPTKLIEKALHKLLYPPMIVPLPMAHLESGEFRKTWGFW